jgi:hypothetical protein
MKINLGIEQSSNGKLDLNWAKPTTEEYETIGNRFIEIDLPDELIALLNADTHTFELGCYHDDDPEEGSGKYYYTLYLQENKRPERPLAYIKHAMMWTVTTQPEPGDEDDGST